MDSIMRKIQMVFHIAFYKSGINILIDNNQHVSIESPFAKGLTWQIILQ